jgi:nucleoside-diphosphate-sugar epimerase
MSPSNAAMNASLESAGDFIIGKESPILVTGGTGFVGARVVQSLLDRGFANIRCFTRSSSPSLAWDSARPGGDAPAVQMVRGNLLSREDCLAATENVSVVLHLAAGRGEKFYPDAYMNSVVTTRNLLDACLRHGCLKRFVNVSSFSVYTSPGQAGRGALDETCPLEPHPELRGEAYCFAKAKQEELVAEYAREHGIRVVVVRPGVVYGPGNLAITGRVGIDTFGVFLHLGGSNPIPFTYVENCAEAIALAGLRKGIEGEVFNVVDDELPTSRQFLRSYKRNVKRFGSLYVPHFASYAFCYLWEWYSDWSQGQLPPAFNRRRWRAYWKKTRYSNRKLKQTLGWRQKVPTAEGFRRYFAACRAGESHA